MDLTEYNHVKNMNYDEYCSYLQTKYGTPPSPYFTRLGKKCRDNTRTRDGLYLHHIREDTEVLLSNWKICKDLPYEYQLSENLCYCDFLEHLYCHILICEKEIKKEKPMWHGVMGAVVFIIPELNDLYSGFVSRQKWRRKCYLKVINDKDVYFELLKHFKPTYIKMVPLESNQEEFVNNSFCKSFQEQYGLWSDDLNQPLYDEIRSLDDHMPKADTLSKEDI